MLTTVAVMVIVVHANCTALQLKWSKIIQYNDMIIFNGI